MTMKRKHKTRSQKRLERKIALATTHQLLSELFVRARDTDYEKFKAEHLRPLSEIIDTANICPDELFSDYEMLQALDNSDMADHLEDAGWQVHSDTDGMVDALVDSGFTVVSPNVKEKEKRPPGNGYIDTDTVHIYLNRPCDKEKAALLLDTWSALDPAALQQAVRLSCVGAA